MLYAVQITLSTEEWDDAIAKSSGAIGDVNNIDHQPIGRIYEIYRVVMKAALRGHHDWLAARGIATVITPHEASERTFIFYFDDRQAARDFKHQFVGPCRKA
jgi:hypothetical protein